jgi:hypothetical protein
MTQKTPLKIVWGSLASGIRPKDEIQVKTARDAQFIHIMSKNS